MEVRLGGGENERGKENGGMEGGRERERGKEGWMERGTEGAKKRVKVRKKENGGRRRLKCRRGGRVSEEEG